MRRDIQALRAIAVLGVVGFHAKIYTSSGFIGVDLFFVISGFVISGLLYERYLFLNKLRMRRFYINRLYRLLPALGTMIFIISFLAFFLFSPFGMQQNSAKTGVGALFFSGNWVIAKVTEGYFDLPAETNLFLNTWSLSVEEQFYLVFPLLLFAIAVISKRNFKFDLFFFTCLGLGLISFSLYFSAVPSLFDENLSWLGGFYSPLTRAWEFLLGMLFQTLAVRKVRSVPRKGHLANSYFLTILLVVLLFAPAQIFRFPSIAIALPIFVISCLLYLDNSRNQILNSKFLSYIGDRSYSIYLWHWPLIVLGKYLYPNSPLVQILFLFGSFLVAGITFRYIENPIRLSALKNRLNTTKLLGAFLVFPLLATASLGYVSSNILFAKYQSGEIAGNYEGDIGAIGFEDFRSKYPSVCSDFSDDALTLLNGCDFELLFIGDSHAGHLVPGFSMATPEVAIAAIGPEIYSSQDKLLREVLLTALNRNTSIKHVIFNSYWAKNGVSPNMYSVVKSISSNGKYVTILDDVPNFPFDAFSCKYGLSIFIKRSICSNNSAHFMAQRELFFPKLKATITNPVNEELIVTSSQYCSTKRCTMLKFGELHYLDLNHLNTLGSAYIAKFVIENSKFLATTYG